MEFRGWGEGGGVNNGTKRNGFYHQLFFSFVIISQISLCNYAGKFGEGQHLTASFSLPSLIILADLCTKFETTLLSFSLSFHCN